tara:strand:- start:3072 stop:3443 length:372 start_codon:yes stop_codon:yes gene_type:complete
MSVINKDTKLFRFELFNFIKFKEFLEKNKAFATAASIVIATQISSLASSFTENIIVPIFNRDLNKDGIKDLQNFEDLKIKLFGIEFQLGKFIIDIIKFFVILYVVFIISIFYDRQDIIMNYEK